MDDVTDGQLVAEALNGEVESFGVLIKKYERTIFNLMFRTTQSSEEAADLTQEAFLKAYEKLETYHAGKRFFSWLYAISINLAKDFLRKEKRTSGIFQEFDGSDPLQAAPEPDGDHSVEMKQIFKVLASLPIDYREALILKYRHGMPVKTIAASLGISVSGAKMRIHRGLEQLRGKL